MATLLILTVEQHIERPYSQAKIAVAYFGWHILFLAQPPIKSQVV